MVATSDKLKNNINTKMKILLAKETAVLGPVQGTTEKKRKKNNRLKDRFIPIP